MVEITMKAQAMPSTWGPRLSMMAATKKRGIGLAGFGGEVGSAQYSPVAERRRRRRSWASSKRYIWGASRSMKHTISQPPVVSFFFLLLHRRPGTQELQTLSGGDGRLLYGNRKKGTLHVDGERDSPSGCFSGSRLVGQWVRPKFGGSWAG